MSYAILRFAKYTGGSARSMEAHNERQKEQYASNPDVDTTRSTQNYHILQPQMRYTDEIQKRIYRAGCRTRKDSIRFVETLITASPEFFQHKTPGEIRAFFQSAVDFMTEQVGPGNIFSAVVHLDEKTPHMHLCFTPITPDNRLCAKEIVGNKQRLSKWQDDFYAHMAAGFPELERGKAAAITGRSHVPTQVFKQSVYLNGQMEQIREALNGIGIRNAAKKKDEAIHLLESWFPAVEDFESKISNYDTAIHAIKAENARLSRRANNAEIKQDDLYFELAALKGELKKYKQFYNRLPNDIIKQCAQKKKESIR